MGLKNFLQQRGFIQDDPAGKAAPVNAAQPAITPVYFPVTESRNATAAGEVSGVPSFVTATDKSALREDKQPDAAFIKFFEDELVKANLPGPDYFEFRQLLLKTQQKLAGRTAVSPELVLQTVLANFEAQDISAAKLVEAAQHYQAILKQKTDAFLQGAAAEKNKQLQKRQEAMQTHEDSIQKLQQQLQAIELQKKQIEESIGKEKTQQEIDRTLGKEGISKIEKAEKSIAEAHEYMLAAIQADIRRLQSV